jgi:hypothetical protein
MLVESGKVLAFVVAAQAKKSQFASGRAPAICGSFMLVM